MTKPIKLALYSMLLGGCFASVSYARDCPVITKNQLETLCNWKIMAVLHLGKAGTVTTPDGTTLMNESKTCGGLDSVKSLFSSGKDITYEGVYSKHPSAPTNPLLGNCVYEIKTLTGKVQHISFGVLFSKPPEKPVQQPEEPTAPRKARTVQGFAYGEGATVEESMKDIEIKRRNTDESIGTPSSKPPSYPPPQPPRRY